jgi:hypothetical protein
LSAAISESVAITATPRSARWLDEGSEPLGDLLADWPDETGRAGTYADQPPTHRQRPAQDEDRGAVLEEQLIGLPAGSAPVLGPGGGLEDVPADHVDGPLVPIPSSSASPLGATSSGVAPGEGARLRAAGDPVPAAGLPDPRPWPRM